MMVICGPTVISFLGHVNVCFSHFHSEENFEVKASWAPYSGENPKQAFSGKAVGEAKLTPGCQPALPDKPTALSPSLHPMDFLLV